VTTSHERARAIGAAGRRGSIFVDSPLARKRLSSLAEEGLRINLDYNSSASGSQDRSFDSGLPELVKSKSARSPSWHEQRPLGASDPGTYSSHRTSGSTETDSPLLTPVLAGSTVDMPGSTAAFGLGHDFGLAKENDAVVADYKVSSPPPFPVAISSVPSPPAAEPGVFERPTFESPAALGSSTHRPQRQSAQLRRSLQTRRRLTVLLDSARASLVEPPRQTSWRMTVPEWEYHHMVTRFGTKEMHRQEVLWELFETEKTFVQSLCGVQRLFALPLKSRTGTWINGVPASVARLMDWLEDILRLHSKIATTMQNLWIESSERPPGERIVTCFADAMHKYMTRLEIYQPYLLRFESVITEVEDMVAAPQNEFGQFIRMQMLAPECGNMTFSSFLLKPVQRLMKFPLFFKVSVRPGILLLIPN
jgi:RhoGEF domain